MARTKRAQILMEPDEYSRLEQIARRQKASVAELIRAAVRDRYFGDGKEKEAILEELFQMNVPVGDWEGMKREIENAHVVELS